MAPPPKPNPEAPLAIESIANNLRAAERLNQFGHLSHQEQIKFGILLEKAEKTDEKVQKFFDHFLSAPDRNNNRFLNGSLNALTAKSKLDLADLLLTPSEKEDFKHKLESRVPADHQIADDMLARNLERHLCSNTLRGDPVFAEKFELRAKIFHILHKDRATAVYRHEGELILLEFKSLALELDNFISSIEYQAPPLHTRDGVPGINRSEVQEKFKDHNSFLSGKAQHRFKSLDQIIFDAVRAGAMNKVIAALEAKKMLLFKEEQVLHDKTRNASLNVDTTFDEMKEGALQCAMQSIEDRIQQAKKALDPDFTSL